MKMILALVALLLAAPALAQTVQTDDPKVSIVFYVKEGTNSPYQGLLQIPLSEYVKLKPADIEVRKIAQFDAWKIATQAAREVQAKVTADDKAAQVEALQQQADDIARQINEIKADPEVAAKLESK